jgi:hypothetical protein
MSNLEKIVEMAIIELIVSPLYVVFYVLGGALGILVSGIIAVGIVVADSNTIRSMLTHG